MNDVNNNLVLQDADVDLFSFLDDEPATFWDVLECHDNGIYFEPLVNYETLLALQCKGLHHASALQSKVNVLNKTFTPTAYLSRTDFELFAKNYLTFGQGYLHIVRNRLNQVLKCEPLLTLYTRLSSDMKDYLYIRQRVGLEGVVCDKFPVADVISVKQHDLRQQIYGVPDYLAALHSIMLNTSATKFRRRYYENGSHAGYILYCTDDKISNETWDSFKAAMRQSRDGGNFKNLYLKVNGGSPEGIKLIPISEVAAKDEFLNIKNISATDQLAAHRVPAILMGIVPQNAGGLGDPVKAAVVFYEHEIAPIQNSFLTINDQLGLEVFKFEPYSLTISN